MKLDLDLDDQHSLALAQFLKRLTWSEMRACAIDTDETYLIKTALAILERAINDEGFNPR